VAEVVLIRFMLREAARVLLRVRRALVANRELVQRLDELERRIGRHDEQLAVISEAVRELTQPATAGRKPIGYQTEADG